MKKVIVVGGGAAGMIAAIASAQIGNQVTIIEKNEKLGKKIFITGKGRCNVTNACEIEDLFKNIISNPKFMYSAIYGFDNHAIMDFFENNGCHLKTERGERVFPVTDHSSDIIQTLQNVIKKLKITLLLNTKVDKIITEDNLVHGVFVNKNEKIEADAVIIATGGKSYPLTGSTGDGYEMARNVGHSITKLSPALVPMQIEEDFCIRLQGLSLKNVNATIEINGKEIYSDFGEMLFTHYGVSGPLILSGSSYFAKHFRQGTDKGVLSLDLKPALSSEQLDKRILRDFEENKNRQFKNAISGLFPTKMIPIMLELSGIDPEKKVNEISKEERLSFVNLIKNWRMTVVRLRDFNEAIITQGGISVKEISPKTMESKLIKGLYFAGEVLDVDALTGGFNLQIAWSTGYLAGGSIE